MTCSTEDPTDCAMVPALPETPSNLHRFSRWTLYLVYTSTFDALCSVYNLSRAFDTLCVVYIGRLTLYLVYRTAA